MATLNAFFSYVHADNEAEGERISRLARDIAAQFEMLTGEQLSLFLDVDSLSWGDDWRKEIDSSLNSVAFFIAVLTPRYFKSPECRNELNFFARRAANLGVQELILPLLYIDLPAFRDPNDPLATDDLITLVKSFQWENWTELRFSEVTSEGYRRGVARLASRLVDANKRAEQIAIIREVEQLESSPNNYDDDEPGFIDKLAKTEETFPKWIDTIGQISREIETVGEIMGEATADAQRADSRGQIFAHRAAIFRRVANELRKPAELIWTLSNQYASELHDIDKGMRELIIQGSEEVRRKPDFKPGYCEFYRSILNMSSTVNSSIESILGLIKATQSLEKMSRDVRPPLRQIRQGLTTLTEAKGVTDQWIHLFKSADIVCDEE